MPGAVWVAFLLDLTIKSAIVLAATHLLTRLLSSLPARITTRAWTFTFVLLLALPVLYPVQGLHGSMLTVIQQSSPRPTDSAPRRSSCVEDPDQQDPSLL
jgi:hypothetical protein